MAVPVIQTSFAFGEVAPSLYGRPDLARYHAAASTMRNMFVSYRGGAYSRAGTAFVGYSKQTGRAYPPRLIPYQFSISQGLALEFGNEYMRVISDGAFVTEPAVSIFALTNASPAVLTATATEVTAATPVNSSVSASYSVGEVITVAGGAFNTPATLQVTATTLLSATPVAKGTGYAPSDTIHLLGGVQTVQPIGSVTTTAVSGPPTIAAAGSGGTDGTQTVTGTTGTGTKFQAQVTITGGVITAVLALTVAGSYTVNPSNLAAEPVTGAGLTGATLGIAMGVGLFTLSTAGQFSVDAAYLTLTQGTTSGGGSGAQFLGLFAPYSLAIAAPGVYSAAPSNPASQASSTVSGVGAEFNLTTGPAVNLYSTGDWISLATVGGMPTLNGREVVVTQLSGTTYALYDVFGAPIDTTALGAYTGGGTVARIYTLATPYSEVDLRWLKFAQSADVMSMCLVNPETGSEYQPYDFKRVNDANWTLVPLATGATIGAPPSAPNGTATATGTVNYEYVYTAVNAADGSESVASAICEVNAAVDIAATAGSISLQGDPVGGAQEYNWYKATPGYGTPVPGGALFGFVGSSYGPSFVDNNIIADFTQVPPLHKNPFARGQVVAVTVLSSTSDWTTATATVSSATGVGAVLDVIINVSLTQNSGNNTVGPGPIVAIIVKNPGAGYLLGDTVVVTGDGNSVVTTLTLGAQSGVYPSVVSYFQQRRAYANTTNNPDTYFMSQPGTYTNFDSRLPTVASDAIIGSPWALQVNGIQWMIPTPGGLVVMTGSSAWMLAGAGSFATNVQPISPSTQDAVPQAFSGCSAWMPPFRVNYDIVYVESKGSLYYALPYQLYALSEPLDLTENSTHLFVGYTFETHAWCEQPFKVLWTVRDDGTMLSLTYLKAQQIMGWGRHDTQGSFVTNCSIIEPPVDALYVGTQRTNGAQTSYMIERMDNRIWKTVEDCWCVDAGLRLPQPTPNAYLFALSTNGAGIVTGVTDLVGGANYSAYTTAEIDDFGGGPGSGAVVALTIVGGVITAVTVTGGANYVYPVINVTDPTNAGSGFSATCVLDNSTTFIASTGVFSSGSVGSVIRSGGCIARVTSYVSATQVVADMLSPVTQVTPNTQTPAPIPPGAWTLTPPVSSIYAPHLAGFIVTGLADGNVIPPTLLPANGQLNLAAPASSLTIGLGYTAQLQTIYLDAGEPTVQGMRKKIAQVTARVEASRGILLAENQPDGSTLSPPQLAPQWGVGGTFVALPDLANKPFNALAQPLYTGDIPLIPASGGFATQGQVAMEQANPLPMQVLAIISDVLQGDLPETRASPKQPSRGNQNR